MAFSKPNLSSDSSASGSPLSSMATSMSMSMAMTLPEHLPPLLPWETKYQGYAKEIMAPDSPSQDHICGICKLLLRFPYQNFCGHRYCVSCVVFVLQGGENATCPVCASDPEDSQMDSDYMGLSRETLHPDNAVRRMLMRQTVKCINPGCDWSGKFGDYDPQHYYNCQYHEVTCKKCGVHYLVKDRAAHEDTCEGRDVECRFCHALIPGNDIAKHEAQLCGKVPVDCPAPDCGKTGILKEQLEQHYKIECRMYMIPCPFGCIFTFVQPNRIDDHDHEALIPHVKLLKERANNIQSSEGNLENENSSTDQNISQILGLLSKAERLDSELDKLEARKMSARSNSTSEPVAVSEKYIAMNRKLTPINEKVDAYPEKLGIIDTGIERVFIRVSKEEREHHTFSHTMKTSMKQAERQSSIQDVTVKELSQRITTLEECCTDSVLMWRVPNFKQKVQEAKNNRTMSIYSPPFYTGKYGYKMCLRLYPNGDGMGKGTHLSLFFVVMKGEYDALLKWPFKQKVTFTLINQLNNNSPIKDQFRPDPSSTSFQRPRGDMNVASGCPYFCPQSKLTEASGFLKDDSMFIKAEVEKPDAIQMG